MLTIDLSLDSPPTLVLPVENLPALYESMVIPQVMDEAIYIEGIELKANRLFGPQPHAETYLCLWEALIPKITCFTTGRFTASLQAVVAAVAYNYNDTDNAPAGAYHIPALPDGECHPIMMQLTFSHIFQAQSGRCVLLAIRGQHSSFLRLEARCQP